MLRIADLTWRPPRASGNKAVVGPKRYGHFARWYLRPAHIATALFLALCVECAASDDPTVGYDALGHLTYTTLDASGLATGKNTLVFDVKVKGERWRVRTEPLIQRKGQIAYFEGGLGPDDCVLMVTAFADPLQPAEPRLEALRAQLRRSSRDEVRSASSTVAVPGVLSNILRRAAASAKLNRTNTVNNAAIARAKRGKYPSVDPSFVAFLWFAFTPPSEEADGTSRMLLQIWDDGNPLEDRFRDAEWHEFAEAPHLVSRAVYQWAGRRATPDGRWARINISDVARPAGVAARYDVDVTTNIGSLVLPLRFRLTRFSTDRSAKEAPIAVSTISASVLSVSQLAPSESLEVQVPARTFVSDYRLAETQPAGTSLRYMLRSNSLPAIEQLKKTSAHRRAVRDATVSSAKQALIRWAVLVSLALVPVILILLFGKVHRS